MTAKRFMLGQCRSVTVDMMKDRKAQDVRPDRMDAASSGIILPDTAANCPLIIIPDTATKLPTPFNSPLILL